MQLVNSAPLSGRSPRSPVAPKELRERLFKRSRPQARRLEILDGEAYSKDLGVLWAAYKAGSFQFEAGLSQADFVSNIEASMSRYQQSWLMDDDSPAFSSGRGPVAIIGVNVIGLIVEPSVLFFKWASKRNMIRVSVSFLSMIRHSKKTGIVIVRTDKNRMILPDHLKRYDQLYFVGKAGPDEYLYSVRGRGTD